MTSVALATCFASGNLARADVLTESGDFGNTRATASNLNALFSASSNAPDDNVYGVGEPTAIVRGRITLVNDVDFFSFSGRGGQQFYFDVDTAGLTSALPDSFLSLFDDTGTQIAKGDDINADALDPGSNSPSDAFTGVFTLPGSPNITRTYFLAITDFGNRPTTDPGTNGTQLMRPVSALDEQAGEGNNDDVFNLAVTSAAAGVDTFVGRSSASNGRGNYALNVTRIESGPASAGAIISEFRFRGMNSSNDDFVEIYNPQTTPLNISGWFIRTNIGTGTSPVFQNSVAPAGSIIPPLGHFLFTGEGYSLRRYGANNALISGNPIDDSGVALFNAQGVVQDAAGFVGSDASLREGLGLSSAPNTNGEHAFTRDFVNSQPKDTSDSSVDFVLVDTASSAAAPSVAGTNGNVFSQLGAPSPKGLTSPVFVNDRVSNTLLDPMASLSAAPNRVRTGSGNGGTLIIRRTLTNNTGRTLNRVRFSVTRITAQNSSVLPGQTLSSQAILALTSSTFENVLLSDGVTSVPVSGTTLEADASGIAAGPSQPLGGGLGSSVSFDTVLTTPLPANQSRNYAFKLDIIKSGAFSVILNIEALPNS